MYLFLHELLEVLLHVLLVRLLNGDELRRLQGIHTWRSSITLMLELLLRLLRLLVFHFPLLLLGLPALVALVLQLAEVRPRQTRYFIVLSLCFFFVRAP
jgi:hypothetical protein